MAFGMAVFAFSPSLAGSRRGHSPLWARRRRPVRLSVTDTCNWPLTLHTEDEWAALRR